MARRAIEITSGAAQIPAELYSPSGTASTGLVVLAHGTDGFEDNERGPWKTMIRGYAKKLATAGLFALVPEYFKKTDTTPGVQAAELMMVKRDEWSAALTDCVSHAKRLPRVDSSRIGLLGFSLGGHLCLHIRAATKPKALVEYFAPMLGGIGPAGTVPHAQIHHGTKDELPLTKFSNAGAIELVLTREHTAVTLFPYTGAGHGFAGKDAANTNARALSQTRTLQFFQTNI